MGIRQKFKGLFFRRIYLLDYPGHSLWLGLLLKLNTHIYAETISKT